MLLKELLALVKEQSRFDDGSGGLVATDSDIAEFISPSNGKWKFSPTGSLQLLIAGSRPYNIARFPSRGPETQKNVRVKSDHASKSDSYYTTAVSTAKHKSTTSKTKKFIEDALNAENFEQNATTQGPFCSSGDKIMFCPHKVGAAEVMAYTEWLAMFRPLNLNHGVIIHNSKHFEIPKIKEAIILKLNNYYKNCSEEECSDLLENQNEETA